MRAFKFLLAASLLCVPAAASAQGKAQARVFVTGLYAGYAHGEPNYLGRQADQVFSPRLLAAIRKDQSDARGEVGALDGDPICDCQDADGLTHVRVEVVDAGPKRARAVARFRLSGQERAVTLNLASVLGQWRVDDVSTAGSPSLARRLRQSPPQT